MNGTKVLLICAICLFKLIVLAAPVKPDFKKNSGSEVVSCNLPAPSNFAVVGTTASTASLSWSGVTGASYFRIRTYNSTTVSALVADDLVPATQTSFTVSGLQGGGVGYTFYISSICADSGQEGTQMASTSAFTVIISEIIVQAFEPIGARTYHSTPYQFAWNTATVFWGELTLNADPLRKLTFSVNIGQSAYSSQSAPVAQIATLSSTLGNTTLVTEAGNPLGPVLKHVSVLLDGVEVYRFEIVQIGAFGIIRRSNTFTPVGYTFKAFTAADRQLQMRSNDDVAASPHFFSPAPNPFDSYLEIPSDNTSEQPLTAQLYNLNGQLVTQASFAPNQPSCRLSTTDVQAGVYFLRCTQGAVTNTFKVLKLN